MELWSKAVPRHHVKPAARCTTKGASFAPTGGFPCSVGLASFAALGKSLRPRTARHYKGDAGDTSGVSEVTRNSQEVATAFRHGMPSTAGLIVITCTLLVLLLGMITSMESGNMLIEIDHNLHSYLLSSLRLDPALFKDVSNKLDDTAQFLCWLTALASLASSTEDGALLLLAVPGGLQFVRFCQGVLKAGFHRARPSNMVSDFSYPSAHTARFTFCAATILLLLLPRLKNHHKKSVSLDHWLAVAFGAWILMGSCRMLADAHWFSDTLGGAALGVDVAAFVELCLLFLQALSLQEKCSVGDGCEEMHQKTQNPCNLFVSIDHYKRAPAMRDQHVAGKVEC